MSGFYRRTIDEEGNESVDFAPNFVHAPGYTLSAEEHAHEADLPDGWEWHDETPSWAEAEAEAEAEAG